MAFAVITNKATNPSFEAVSGTTEVRRNYANDPKMSAVLIALAGTSAVSATAWSRRSATANQHTRASGGAPVRALDMRMGASAPSSGALTVQFEVFVSHACNIEIAYRPDVTAAGTTYVMNSIAVPAGYSLQTVSATIPSAGWTMGANAGVTIILRDASLPDAGTIAVTGVIVEAASTVGTWFDGSTQAKVRRNLYNNPSSETISVGLYFAFGSEATTRVAGGLFGSWSTRHYRTSGTSKLGGGHSASRILVSAGETITASMYVKPEVAMSVRIGLRWATPGDVAYPQDNGQSDGSFVVCPVGVWTRISVTAVAPAGTGGVWLAHETQANVNTGEGFLFDGILVEKSATLGEYLDGANPVAPYLAGWDGTAHQSASYLYDPDLTPSWTGTANASVSILSGQASTPGLDMNPACKAYRSNHWASSGAYSLRITPVTTSNSSEIRVAGSSASLTGKGVTFVAGQTYTVQAKFRQAAAQIAGGLNALARTLRATFNGTGGTTVSAQATNTAGVQALAITFTVPLDATNCGVLFYNGAAAGNGDVWWDDLLIVEGAYDGDYFDGSTTDTDRRRYDWLGVANASASTETPVPRVLVPPVLQDPLYRGQRREYYRVDLMTNRDGTIGQLDGVSDVNLSYDGDPTGVLTTTGSLSLDDLGQNIDWLNARCQPWANVNGEAWPLGVYIMSAPTEQHESTGRSWSVLLKDKLSILDEDLMAENFALDTGDNIVDAIRQLIADAGEANHAISADPRELSGPLTWPPATSRLTIVQELLKMLNFAPLWVDGWGQYVGEPFVDPQARPIEGHFEEGVNSIHLPSFQMTMDVASIPNRLIGVSSNSGGGLMIIADNEDPTNPYSIPARNRVVARQEDFEAADLTALAALVVRRMQELMAPGSVVEFQHAIVPLRPTSVVRFTSDGVDLDGVVLSTSVTLAAGEMMQTVVQEVVRVDLTVS